MKKKSRLFIYDESTVGRKPRPRADQGMSPARTGDCIWWWLMVGFVLNCWINAQICGLIVVGTLQI